MAGSGKKKDDFWKNNPFGGIFDFDGNGKEDIGEQWLRFKILEECVNDEDNNDDLYDFNDSSFDKPKRKRTWRDNCEDGSAYGLNPKDFEEEYEYEAALEEVKYAWRETCEDGEEYDVFPEDYETEEDYLDAIEEAKYEWRDECDDVEEYDIYPEDYETEEEYYAALKEAEIKYAWRDNCEDGSDYGIYPEDYETEEEYYEALNEEMECDF